MEYAQNMPQIQTEHHDNHFKYVLAFSLFIIIVANIAGLSMIFLKKDNVFVRSLFFGHKVQAEIFLDHEYDISNSKSYYIGKDINLDFGDTYLQAGGNNLAAIAPAKLKFKSDEEILLESGHIFLNADSEIFYLDFENEIFEVGKGTQLFVDADHKFIYVVNGSISWNRLSIDQNQMLKWEVDSFKIHNFETLEEINDEGITKLINFLAEIGIAY